MNRIILMDMKNQLLRRYNDLEDVNIVRIDELVDLIEAILEDEEQA